MSWAEKPAEDGAMPYSQQQVPDAGDVEEAIRASIYPGQILHTPSRSAPFKIKLIDSEGVVLLLGKGEWETRLTWDCLEGVVPYLREYGGEIEIGGRHEVEGRPGTLDGYLKECLTRTTAGWVAAMLEEADIVTIIRDRPARVKLKRDGT
jgi:hypothetical protein